MMDLTNRKRDSPEKGGLKPAIVGIEWDIVGDFCFLSKLGYTENGNVNRENNDKEQ